MFNQIYQNKIKTKGSKVIYSKEIPRHRMLLRKQIKVQVSMHIQNKEFS
jgi:hypothetical protein